MEALLTSSGNIMMELQGSCSSNCNLIILPDLILFAPEPVILVKFSPLQIGTVREQKAATPRLRVVSSM